MLAPLSRALLTLTAAAALLLGADPAAAQELVVWHGYRGEERAALERVVADYQEKQAGKGPGIRLLAVPSDAFLDKITAAVPRGQGPDVFIGPHDRLGGWVEAGNTVDPSGFYADDAVRERFVPATLESLTYRGELYGLPLNFKAITLIYNRKLVKEPPKTTRELEALVGKLTRKQEGRYGLAFPHTDYYYVAALQNGFGGRAFEGRRPTLAAPENVKAMELLSRWAREFLPPDPSTTLVTSLFNKGRAAMVFSGPWFLGEVAKGIDVGLAPLPRIDEAGGQPMKPWMTVEGAFVAAPSKQKEAAYAFVLHLTGLDGARVMAVQGRQTPANQEVYGLPEVKKDRVLQAFFEQGKAAVPMPNIPEMTAMWSPATAALGAIARGSTSPKAALEKAQAEVEQAVAGLRKPGAEGTGGAQ
jgi:arabinogalactan oligomer/maltooligosaccharide transport system substrate-binding protein